MFCGKPCIYDHLRNVPKHGSIHFIAKEKIQPALLFYLLTTKLNHDEKALLLDCGHSFVNDSPRVNDLLSSFTFGHVLYNQNKTQSIVVLPLQTWQKHMNGDKHIDQMSLFSIQCCYHEECLKQLLQIVKYCQTKECHGKLHIIMPFTEHMHTLQKFKEFVLLSTKEWNVVTDFFTPEQCLIVPTVMDLVNYKKSCKNICCATTNDGTVNSMKDTHTSLTQQKYDELIHLGHFIKHFIVNKVTSQSSQNLEDKNKTSKGSKFLIVVESILDAEILCALLTHLYSISDQTAVEIQTITNIADTRNPTKDKILILVLTKFIFLNIVVQRFDGMILNVNGDTYIQYTSIKRKMVELAVNDVIWLCYDNCVKVKMDTYKNIEDFFYQLTEYTKYHGSVGSTENIKILQQYCNFLSFNMYGNVCIDVERKVDQTDSVLSVQTTLYLPIKSMLKKIIKGDIITVSLATPNYMQVACGLSGDDACSKTITMLQHAVGELDENCIPSLTSVQEEDEEKLFKNLKHEETKEEEDVFIEAEQLVHTYIIEIESLQELSETRTFKGSDEVIVSDAASKHSLYLCSKGKLPRIPSFKLYDHYGPFEVVLTYGFDMEMSKEEFSIMVQFRNTIFNNILRLSDNGKQFVELGTEFLFALGTQASKSLDFNFMHSISDNFRILENHETINQLMKPTGHEIKLVLPKHLLSLKVPPLRTFPDLETNILAGDEFPDQTKALTYQDYYCKKYSISVQESETMIPVKFVKSQLSAITFKDYNKSVKPDTIIHFPESLCLAYPISYDMWREVCLLPSILYKIKQNVVAENIFLSVMNLSSSNHSLEGTMFKLAVETCSEKAKESPLRIVETFVTALVTPSAAEDVRNEVLEFFGDSFLKYAVTTQLFLCYPDANENLLSFFKTKIISNKKLVELGISRQIHDFIFHERFDAKLLKSYIKINGDTLSQNCLKINKSKMIADAVEALIAAFYKTTSEMITIDALEWFGIDMSCFKQLQQKRFYEYDCSNMNTNGVEKMLVNLTTDITKLEHSLNYTFKNQLFYVEACTHGTYPRRLNPVTFSNQRLEFLGDAVLEVLVTNEISRRNEVSSKYDHGQLSSIRSGIVNTFVFAVLAVSLDLHKHLKFVSVEMMSLIHVWIQKVKMLEKEERTHNKEIFSANVLYDDDGNVTEVPKDLADCFEAIVGAVYLDSGGDLSKVWVAFYPHLEKVIDFYFTHNPLSSVQYLQHGYPDMVFKRLPRRIDGAHCWKTSYNGYDTVVTGRTSKIAKGIAAAKSIQYLQNNLLTSVHS